MVVGEGLLRGARLTQDGRLVETGGDASNLQGGAGYNFLQIKDTGTHGKTTDGFASYKTIDDAIAAAVKRIKGEPGLRARGSAPKWLKPIAATWDDGPGVTEWTGREAGYLSRLREKYRCVRAQASDVAKLRKEVGDTQAGDIFGPGIDLTPPNPINELKGFINDTVMGFIKALTPVLLTATGAAVGLALIGYGIAQLAKSDDVGEHVKQGASLAATTAKVAT